MIVNNTHILDYILSYFQYKWIPNTKLKNERNAIITFRGLISTGSMNLFLYRSRIMVEQTKSITITWFYTFLVALQESVITTRHFVEFKASPVFQIKRRMLEKRQIDYLTYRDTCLRLEIGISNKDILWMRKFLVK